MVPAGPAVDEQMAALAPLLGPGDMVIDAGNALFHDSIRRAAGAVPFLGIGVSGGEDGARHGPAIMAGGDPVLWARVAPILTAIAARAEDGTPCATHFGPGGAGHFVKTVHNGIEYADMQLIAEAYGLMRDGMGWSTAQVGDCFARWNDGPLRSYLVEITATVARTHDPATGQPVLDLIVDAAGQKGTGRWTAVEAQHLGTPIPAIEAAVAARNLSAARALRAEGAALWGAAARPLAPGALTVADLEGALIAGKVLAYAQGFAMMAATGPAFGWTLDLAAVARVWRAGCIIRSAMLNDMATALAAAPDRNLAFAAPFADLLRRHEAALRRTVARAAEAGIAVPALSSSLAYFDSLRTARGTANLIQAQRDYFGAHGFERLDRPGETHLHGPWAGQGAA
jgi:6-phosphogluconate dehydrogenase